MLRYARVVALASLLLVGGTPTQAREAQAVPGTFESSVTLQNPGTADAIAAVNFVTATGGLALTNPYTVTVPAGGSTLIYVPNVTGLQSGRYSVVVDSDQPVYTIANLLSSGPVQAASYSGFRLADAGTSFYVPSVYKNYVGLYNSQIVVQNTDENANAAVTVQYKDGQGNVVATDTAALAPNASITFDQSAKQELPPDFVGSAVVTADRAVGAAFFVSDPVNRQFSASNGFKEGSALTYLPVVYNNYSAAGWVTSFLVQNVGNAAATVEVQYSEGTVKRATVQPGSSQLFYQPNEGLPDGFNGSAIVRSTNGVPVVAIANIRNAAGNLSAYNGFTTGTTSVSLPVIYKNYSGQLWGTSFTIQNVDAMATDLTITYSNGIVETIANVQPGQSVLQYQPGKENLASGFNGSVTVRSSRAKIVGVVNELSLAAPGGEDWLLTYNGFNQ